MNSDNRNTCRLRRYPVKQDPRPLVNDQDRVEKLSTGKPTSMKGKGIAKATEKLKIARDMLTGGTCNIQIL